MDFKQKIEKTVIYIRGPPPLDGKCHEKWPHFFGELPYISCYAFVLSNLAGADADVWDSNGLKYPIIVSLHHHPTSSQSPQHAAYLFPEKTQVFDGFTISERKKLKLNSF